LFQEGIVNWVVKIRPAALTSTCQVPARCTIHSKELRALSCLFVCLFVVLPSLTYSLSCKCLYYEYVLGLVDYLLVQSQFRHNNSAALVRIAFCAIVNKLGSIRLAYQFWLFDIGYLENTFLIFLYRLCLKCFSFRWILEMRAETHVGLSVKCFLLFSDFNQNSGVSTDFTKLRRIKLHERLLVVLKLLYVHRQLNGDAN
jgi:hypothetical protein